MCSRKHIKFSSGDFFSQFFKTQKSVFYKSDNKSIPKKFVLWVHGPSVFNSILVKMHFFCVLKFWESKSPDENLICFLEHTLLRKNICGIAQIKHLWPDSEWHRILMESFIKQEGWQSTLPAGGRNTDKSDLYCSLVLSQACSVLIGFE